VWPESAFEDDREGVKAESGLENEAAEQSPDGDTERHSVLVRMMWDWDWVEPL
jgi:hypothetical protein